MGAAYGKKKAYSIDHEPPSVKNGKHPNGKASAYADLQQHRADGAPRRPAPDTGHTPRQEHLEGGDDNDLIKPKKLVNPVKASKSHQRAPPRADEQLQTCVGVRRIRLPPSDRQAQTVGGAGVEMKPELQRVLESRKRDQLIKQRKQEDEARRKISPLEAELLKRHRKLEELEKQRQQEQEENLKAPEFVKVKENLRRTSFNSKEEKEV
ncbi:hypothetical protein L3Q82_024486 [Scortum barcoo]|uniref:Uncharacterized protein n=1 Tax=Scortum barcoo TaxID=214431 RepID=A0ACB8WQ63_9TELE|nr:hypothetical protein L3Q82_024486 [Scortum barcoo]